MDAKDFIFGDYAQGTDSFPDGGFNPHGDLNEQAEAANLEMMMEAEARELHEATAVTHSFRTADGKVFLEWLKTKTVDLPTFFPADYALGAKGVVVQLPAEQQGFIREGQNMIYREIIRLIGIAEAGPSAALTDHLATPEEPANE